MKTKDLITPKDVEDVFGEKLSEYVKNKIEKNHLYYRNFSREERDVWLLKIISTLVNENKIIKAGKHRIYQWEEGWEENLERFKKSLDKDDLKPRYFGKYKAVRWKGDLVEPISKNFEQRILYVIEDWLFDKYLKEVNCIYEFGCGTGHNLIRANEVNPTAELWGLDWANSSGRILEVLNERKFFPQILFHKFNFFNPDKNFNIKKNSGIYTVAALEQVGEKHKKFVDYLIQSKPKVCIHIEPIAELLNKNRLLDYLSLEYFKLRNYLSCFLTHLQKEERRGRLKIHETKRTHIGSLFIEGYSVIVWSPK